MKRNTLLKTMMISAALSALLAGCGSTASSDAGDSTAPHEESGKTIGGSAVDGYLRNAFVCLDINRNNECDTGEPYTKTEADGTYTLDIGDVTEQQRTKARLLVTGGVDVSSGDPFTGLLMAPLIPDTPVVNITPIMTLVAAKSDDNTNVKEAMEEVAKSLGIADPKEVNEDPLKLADKRLYAKGLKIQKALEVVAEAMDANGSLSRKDAFAHIAKRLAERMDGTKEKGVDEALDEVDFSSDDVLKKVDTVKGVAVNLAKEIDVQEGENPYEAGAMADALKQHIMDAIKKGDVHAGDVGSVASQFRSDKRKEMAKRLLKLIRFEGSEEARIRLIEELSKLSLRFDMSITEFEEVIKNSDLKEEMKKELIAQIETVLLQQQQNTKAPSIEGVDLYTLEFHHDHGTYKPKVQKIRFENGTATFIDMQVDAEGNFVPVADHKEESKELYWDETQGGWKREQEQQSEQVSYTKEADGSLFIPAHNVRVKVTNLQDLSGKRVISMPKVGLFPELTFDEGAKRYVVEVIEKQNDEYRLWDPVYQKYDGDQGSDPYTSLESFFTDHSTAAEQPKTLSWQHEDDAFKQVLFDGKLSDGKGALVLELRQPGSGMDIASPTTLTSKVIGSWEVVRKGESTILVLHPRIALGDHQDDQERKERIYSMVDGTLYVGAHVMQRPHVHTDIGYNTAAAQTIKNYLIAQMAR